MSALTKNRLFKCKRVIDHRNGPDGRRFDGKTHRTESTGSSTSQIHKPRL